MALIPNSKKTKKVTILSLDGGGIRGIITCVILKYLEERLQKMHQANAKLGDYVDFIAGSSTGALIAGILLFPDEHTGKANYSIQKAFDLYAQEGEDIFNVSVWQKIINPFGLLNEKISQHNLEKSLLNFFGDLTLKEFIKPCVITSYDMQNRAVKIFNTLDAVNPMDNFYVRDICRASTAAPTYFEPALITSMYKQQFALLDGGIYANNPALCALAEVKKIPFETILRDNSKANYPDAKDLFMVSISTGSVLKPYAYEKYKDVGRIEWILPVIDMLLSANSEAVDYQARKLFSSYGKRGKKSYYRLHPTLKNASPEMDNVKPGNIEALIQDGYDFVQKHQLVLDDIAKQLIENLSGV
jgi:uncharacterized protein